MRIKSKVASRKSKVESQCKVSPEASLLGYAEPQPDFMSEANKVEGRKLRVSYPEYPLIGSGTEWGTKKGEMISHFSFYDYTSSRIKVSRSP